MKQQYLCHSLSLLFCCCIISAVHGISFTTTLAPSVTARTGSRIQLNCSIDEKSRNGSHILWTKDNARVLNGSRVNVDVNNTLIIFNALLPDTGNYKCEALAGAQTISTSTRLVVNDVPGSPRHVILFNKQAESVNVFWTFNTGQDHNSPIMAYRIEYRSNHNQTIRVQNVTHPNANNASVKLSPWGSYTFRVAGINDVGIGVRSAWTNAYLTESAVPYFAPKGLKVEGSGRFPNRLFVSWLALPGEEQNAPGVGYVLFYKRGDRQSYIRVNVSNVNTFFINGLDRERSYDVYILPYNQLGNGLKATPIVRGFTSEAPPRSPPVNFAAFAVTANSIGVSWQPIPQAYIEGTLRSYTLKIWDVRSPNQVTTANLGPTRLIYTFYNLRPYTTYGIIAYGNSRSSGTTYSARLTVRTHSAIPGPVRQFAAGSTAAGSVVAANWLPPTSANGVIIGYRLNITYSLAGRNRDRYGLYLIPGNVHHFTLNHVPRGSYILTIEAENFAGFGPIRTAQAYAAGDDFAAYDLIARPFSNQRVRLNWRSKKNPARFEVRIRVAKNNTSWFRYAITAPGTARTMTVDGLDGNNNYFIRVVSVISAGRHSTESSPTNQALAVMSDFEGNLPPFNRAWFVILFAIAIVLALIFVYLVYRQFRNGPVGKVTQPAPPPRVRPHRAPAHEAIGQKV